MERENRNLKVLVVILCILVLGLGCYFFYDKVLSDDNGDTSNDNINDTQNNDDNGAVNLTKQEASIIVKNIMDKFYDEVFYGYKATYCGEYDYDDTIVGDEYTYYKSATYSTLKDLKDYLGTYISPNLINFMLGGNDTPKYQERDNKLYCLGSGAAGISYNKENSNFNVLSFTNSTIIANANVSTLVSGAPYTINATLSIEKNDDIWVLSSYEEIRS